MEPRVFEPLSNNLAVYVPSTDLRFRVLLPPEFNSQLVMEYPTMPFHYTRKFLVMTNVGLRLKHCSDHCPAPPRTSNQETHTVMKKVVDMIECYALDDPKITWHLVRIRWKDLPVADDTWVDVTRVPNTALLQEFYVGSMCSWRMSHLAAKTSRHRYRTEEQLWDDEPQLMAWMRENKSKGPPPQQLMPHAAPPRSSSLGRPAERDIHHTTTSDPRARAAPSQTRSSNNPTAPSKQYSFHYGVYGGKKGGPTTLGEVRDAAALDSHPSRDHHRSLAPSPRAPAGSQEAPRPSTGRWNDASMDTHGSVDARARHGDARHDERPSSADSAKSASRGAAWDATSAAQVIHSKYARPKARSRSPDHGGRSAASSGGGGWRHESPRSPPRPTKDPQQQQHRSYNASPPHHPSGASSYQPPSTPKTSNGNGNTWQSGNGGGWGQKPPPSSSARSSSGWGAIDTSKPSTAGWGRPPTPRTPGSSSSGWPRREVKSPVEIKREPLDAKSGWGVTPHRLATLPRTASSSSLTARQENRRESRSPRRGSPDRQHQERRDNNDDGRETRRRSASSSRAPTETRHGTTTTVEDKRVSEEFKKSPQKGAKKGDDETRALRKRNENGHDDDAERTSSPRRKGGARPTPVKNGTSKPSDMDTWAIPKKAKPAQPEEVEEETKEETHEEAKDETHEESEEATTEETRPKVVARRLSGSTIIQPGASLGRVIGNATIVRPGSSLGVSPVVARQLADKTIESSPQPPQDQPQSASSSDDDDDVPIQKKPTKAAESRPLPVKKRGRPTKSAPPTYDTDETVPDDTPAKRRRLQRTTTAIQSKDSDESDEAPWQPPAKPVTNGVTTRRRRIESSPSDEEMPPPKKRPAETTTKTPVEALENMDTTSLTQTNGTSREEEEEATTDQIHGAVSAPVKTSKTVETRIKLEPANPLWRPYGLPRSAINCVCGATAVEEYTGEWVQCWTESCGTWFHATCVVETHPFVCASCRAKPPTPVPNAHAQLWQCCLTNSIRQFQKTLTSHRHGFLAYVKHGYNGLVAAAAHGAKAIIEYFLVSFTPAECLDSRDLFCRNPVHVATLNGHFHCLPGLIILQAKWLEMPDLYGNTPLIYLLQKQPSQALTLLRDLPHLTKIVDKSTGNTLAHAVCQIFPDNFAALLQALPSSLLLQTNHKQELPAMLAMQHAAFAAPHLAALVARSGPSPMWWALADADGRTALHHALRHKHGWVISHVDVSRFGHLNLLH
ncbi:hypothetical protein As57867_013887, partial [Aphanomyces stellatus]